MADLLFAGSTKFSNMWEGPMLFMSPETTLGLYLLAAASSGLPAIDFEKTCQQIAKSMGSEMAKASAGTLENCLRQEREAREKMNTNWPNYPASDRHECVDTTGYAPSYVEWLTCLEMDAQVRAMRKKEPKG
jgi:hypothetical protein